MIRRTGTRTVLKVLGVLCLILGPAAHILGRVMAG